MTRQAGIGVLFLFGLLAIVCLYGCGSGPQDGGGAGLDEDLFPLKTPSPTPIGSPAAVGDPDRTHSAPAITHLAVTSNLTQYQPGTIDITCTITPDPDSTVRNVTADLSFIGGRADEVLLPRGINGWCRDSIAVAPVDSGEKTITVTAVDSNNLTAAASVRITVAPVGVIPTPASIITPTVTPTITPTPTPTLTITITPAVTPALTPSPIPTPEPTVKPIPTVTPLVTPSLTPTPIITPAVTPSPSPTPSVTPTPTVTITPTPMPTPTPTISPTPTPTPKPTITPTATPTPIPSPTPTPTPSPTPSPTPTPSPCLTPAPTPSPTPTPTPPREDTLTLDCGNGVTITLIKIPAGSFMMGTNSEDYSWLSSSRPVHSVTISRAFYLGKYEVTQKQYQAVMGVNPSFFAGDPDRPVEQVSWHDAVAFCQALSERSGYSVRLPTEAEWEYACKADHGYGDTKYFFGDDDAQVVNYAWDRVNSLQDSDYGTHPVGLKPPNSFGLYDLSGNVWEWCNDWWSEEYYDSSPSTDPPGPASGTYRVLRGGSWISYEYSCRSSSRHYGVPSYADPDYGFRIAIFPPR